VEAPPAIARALNLGLADNGGLETVALPEFGAWVAPVNGKFTWKITPDTGKSGRITLVFFSREVLLPWEHRSLVISSDLADEVTVLLDGNFIPDGADFMKGETRLFKLLYKNGDLLNGVPLAINWLPDAGLVEGDLACQPPFHQFSTQHEWRLTGTGIGIVSGTFKLKLFNEAQSATLLTPTNRLLVGSKTIAFIQDNGEALPLHPRLFLIPSNTDFPLAVQVKHPNGSPAADVWVRILIGNDSLDELTDSRGRFDFTYRLQQGSRVVLHVQVGGGDEKAEAWLGVLPQV